MAGSVVAQKIIDKRRAAEHTHSGVSVGIFTIPRGSVPSELSHRLAQIVGYTVQNDALLTEALTHASSAGHRLESNERMEFLGDAVLGFVVCEFLFRNYTDLLEGELTKIKSAVVSRRVCALISTKLDLASLMTLGKGMTGKPSLPSSVVAAALEAVIAAIYLDGGMEPAKAFILQHVTPYIREAADSAHQHNFKSVLQQHAQRHMTGTPLYVLLDEKGPDHSKAFEVCVEINGRRFSPCWANSKKEAEQNAALIALRELGLAQVDETGSVQMTTP